MWCLMTKFLLDIVLTERMQAFSQPVNLRHMKLVGICPPSCDQQPTQQPHLGSWQIASAHDKKSKHWHPGHAPALWLHRAIVEIDSEKIEHPTARLAQGNGVRIGCIPVKYDAARKKALWYWFIACDARADVRPASTHTSAFPCFWVRVQGSLKKSIKLA